VRTLPIDDGSGEMLKEYIERGGPVLSDGKRLIFGINRHRAWQIVKECAGEVGLPKLVNPETSRVHNVSPHRLRDAFGPAEAAEERGSNFISYHSDIREFAPNVFLTGVVWNWGPIMTDIIKAAYNGTWSQYPNQDWWYGPADGGVKLAPFSDSVPDNVRNMVE
jgi:hypothetical protein